MIQVWKILHEHDHVDKNKWLSSAYVPGENERQTRMSIESEVTCCAHRIMKKLF